MHTLPFVLITVLFNTIAQILLKEGMNRIGYFTFSMNNLLPVGIKISTSPWILSGLATYVISVIVWLGVLARADVSQAYPLASLGYITTALAGYWLLHETLSLSRISGIAIIMIGVYLVSRS